MRKIVDDFHTLYYDHQDHSTWTGLTFMGHKTLKCPLDLWIYQEIFNDIRPDFIIETGTFEGGSAIYWASLCHLFQTGKVISIDLNPRAQPSHPLVTYIKGDSVGAETLKQVKAIISDTLNPNPTVLINLDSLHLFTHVRDELIAYHPLVSLGSYMIVEDTNLCGHPIEWDRAAFGNKGPWEAVDEFLLTHPEFEVDASREKLLMTFNPRGYLKRVSQ